MLTLQQRLYVICCIVLCFKRHNVVQSIYAQKRVNLKQIAIVIMMAVLVSITCIYYQKKSPPKSTWWNIVIFDDNDKRSKVAAGHFLE